MVSVPSVGLELEQDPKHGMGWVSCGFSVFSFIPGHKQATQCPSFLGNETFIKDTHAENCILLPGSWLGGVCPVPCNAELSYSFCWTKCSKESKRTVLTS